MASNFPQGSLPVDGFGNEGIDPPVDEIAAGYVGLQVDRIDPTGQAMGAAQMQSASAIAAIAEPISGGTGGVAPDGRTDNVG